MNIFIPQTFEISDKNEGKVVILKEPIFIRRELTRKVFESIKEGFVKLRGGWSSDWEISLVVGIECIGR